nr:Chain K1, Nup145N/Nup100/Nup116 R1 [Saccharomyces cerevisiae]7TBI_K2 Chain K2, Nup145N/Nup100/Nup116 R1 [Saccharomyces cerevisiae]7TBJ_K1 Chain K1, NUP98 R1 [Homo sapiens]7TBJ_K2 Chain K2, NUP98 R1 [Homo sapiens]7TBJ_K3 Chain K3, NUP98 R1 [Homo sapiens]7TBJ_K4 Chain K4, NUP98 R1 [Homo sapiens]7TBJ_K5 Chain K5, NUP98 R1 [Homo sapiens]7TBK_K1 Chain K1, NUP98 R1 [Homo sapiens]7TBK_K2 Chain K2, NUP98 R1 [Homo sapiens]7TBK_K3 Chain K3, NUP98 R1 [Homo sapiens]7TBK_K4 Chain K4, NUP98 R1 [Homo
ILPMYKLSP